MATGCYLMATVRVGSPGAARSFVRPFVGSARASIRPLLFARFRSRASIVSWQPVGVEGVRHRVRGSGGVTGGLAICQVTAERLE